MNQFNGIGNLTADPELRKTQSNIDVCEFSIAINEGYGDKKTTDFIDCLAWRTLAENLCKYQRKGDKIAVTGKLKKESWQDKQGKIHYRTYILAGNIEFLNPKKGNIIDVTEPEIPEIKTGFDADKSPDLNLDSENLPFY